jgi:hypothetical protein
MDTKERIALANKFFEDNQNLIGNLYARWQDEKEYEDINDYGKPVQKALDKIGGKLVSMHSRPFGFTYEMDGFQYRVRHTAKEYSYARVDQVAPKNPASGPAKTILGDTMNETPLQKATRFIAMARDGHLPDGFNDWALANKGGWTVAHQAVKAEDLPEDFDGWDWADNTGWTVAHEAAANHRLPVDFKRWDMDGGFGYTVAHAAARVGSLPDDFDQWELRDEDGTTVAQMAAFEGHLPEDFDQWHLVGGDGRTVAHTAAEFGHLPPDFDQWELKDAQGISVAELAADLDCLPPAFDRWDLVPEEFRPEGWRPGSATPKHGL